MWTTIDRIVGTGSEFVLHVIAMFILITEKKEKNSTVSERRRSNKPRCKMTIKIEKKIATI